MKGAQGPKALFLHKMRKGLSPSPGQAGLASLCTPATLSPCILMGSAIAPSGQWGELPAEQQKTHLSLSGPESPSSSLCPCAQTCMGFPKDVCPDNVSGHLDEAPKVPRSTGAQARGLSLPALEDFTSLFQPLLGSSS